MQDLVKKYFWLVPILVAIGSSALAAKGVSHILEGAFLSDSAELAEVEAPKPGQRQPARETRSKSGTALAARNMFCSTCTPEAPTVDPATPVDPNAVPITSLPLQLLATNVSGNEQHSFATIRNTATSSQGAYWKTQEIPGAGKVERIAGGYVDFHNPGTNRLERISLLDVARPPEPPPPPTPAAPPPSTGEPTDELTAKLDQGIKKMSEDSYEVDRNLVNELLANPMSVARGARIVPSVKDGQPNGFKLYAIRPNSVYAKLGMRNGDTISSVNGFDLSSPDKALEVYTKVREASNLSVSVIRRGKPQTLNYSIR
ncbi:MAG TPA: type II secretion system protein GspC [Haliangium sp.]|nr:type II secretion system protein GspC [Haliangium sp.]